MFNQCGLIIDGVDIRIKSSIKNLKSLFIESFKSKKFNWKNGV
jgi:hypothetical protein